MTFNQIAIREFGIEYLKLGAKEQEWVQDEFYRINS